MTPEDVIQFVIYSHILLGSIALIAGTVALVTKKGSQPHRKAGNVFYYTLLISVFISLVIAVTPNHVSPFLFSIGILSIYLLISGRRSLKLYQPETNTKIDMGIAAFVILVGLAMVSCAFLLYRQLHLVLLVFGIVTLLLGCRDLYMLQDHQRILDNWLAMHMGKMIGGYIAAITAVLVVNEVFPGKWNWFAPLIVGGVVITYWKRQIKAKQKMQHS